MQCDMCGKEDVLFRTAIEGTEMNTCKECSRYGNVLKKVVAPVVKKIKIKEPEEPKIEIINMLVENYPEIIRNKREKLGMKQKEFASMLSEKESLIHKIETGAFEPSLNMARRFERALGVSLIQEYKEEHKKLKAEEGEDLTIGDMIKVRKKS